MPFGLRPGEAAHAMSSEAMDLMAVPSSPIVPRGRNTRAAHCAAVGSLVITNAHEARKLFKDFPTADSARTTDLDSLDLRDNWRPYVSAALTPGLEG